MEWFTYNCLGGLSLWVARLFGVLGWPAVLVATKPKFHSVEMAGGHPLLLVRSTFRQHADAFGVLLGEAIENFVSSSVRALASSCMRSSSNFFIGKGFGFKLHAFLFQLLVRRRRQPRDPCLDCIVIFLFTKGAFA